MNRQTGRARRIRIAIAAALLLCATGTASAAKDDPDYDRLSRNLGQLVADPALGSLAPAEIALANQALSDLAEFGGKRKVHEHYVFIARQRIDTAYAVARSVALERQLVDLDREHDKILLAASQRDTDMARQELERQRIQAQVQAEEADRLRQEADDARAQSAQDSQQADTAKKQAAQARQLAAAQAREAELARKEADLLSQSGAKASGTDAAKNAGAAKAASSVAIGEAAFAPGQAVLKGAASAQIAKIAAAASSGQSVRIEAYANDGGSAKDDLALSQKRAAALRDAIAAAGVPAKRITAIGAGAKAGTTRGATVSLSP